MRHNRHAEAGDDRAFYRFRTTQYHRRPSRFLATFGQVVFDYFASPTARLAQNHWFGTKLSQTERLVFHSEPRMIRPNDRDQPSSQENDGFNFVAIWRQTFGQTCVKSSVGQPAFNLFRISDVKLKINSRMTPTVFSQQVWKKIDADGGACTD